MKKKDFANVISTVGHPFALLSFLGIWIYFKKDFSPNNFLTFGLIGLVLTSMILYLYKKKQAGEITNFDVSKRTQRTQIYRLASLILGILALIFYFTHQPIQQIILLFYVFLLVFIGSFINKMLKMSLHTATSVFVSLAMLHENILIGSCLFIFSVVIAWSRLELKRHKLKEIFAGAIVGIIIGLSYLVTLNYLKF